MFLFFLIILIFFFYTFLKVFRISCFICFFFLLKGTLLILIPKAMLRKGLIRRGVCLFFTIGHYRKLIYFFLSRPTAVFADC